MKLEYKEIERHGGMRTMRISGFSDKELSELKSMEHYEAKYKILEMLGNTGTCWHNGYGVYGLWFDNEYAYLNIGTSCD